MGGHQPGRYNARNRGYSRIAGSRARPASAPLLVRASAGRGVSVAPFGRVPFWFYELWRVNRVEVQRGPSGRRCGSVLQAA